jgi:hypothetical protein
MRSLLHFGWSEGLGVTLYKRCAGAISKSAALEESTEEYGRFI